MASPAIAVILILIIVPIGAAALLKWARCPGWAVVGGAVAGILLGPSIFGRVLPDQYEKLFVGGITQRAELDQLRSRQGADVLAAKEAGALGQRLVEIDSKQIAERADLESLWEKAKYNDQSVLRYFTFIIVALTLIGAGTVARENEKPKPNIVTSMSVGVWAAGLPGGFAFAISYFLWSAPFEQSLLMAAAVAIGPWSLTVIDREAANQAELGGAAMMQSAGRIATILAIMAVAWALYSKYSSQALMMTAPILATVIPWISPQLSQFIRGAANQLLVPVLCACVGMKIDIYADFSFWPIIVLLIIGGDVRWLGAYFGAMVLGGRSSLRTMRLVLGSMACGPTQLAVTAIAIHTWSMPSKYAFALLLSAILIEVTVGARRSMAKRLIETEEEIAKISEE
ncbi:MAG: hypothetical protein IH984_03240 [Planctomycetes bacterium]|nr:hypothetical protein [Planctomycetota bacterium]